MGRSMGRSLLRVRCAAERGATRRSATSSTSVTVFRCTQWRSRGQLLLPTSVPLLYPNVVAKPLPRPESAGQRKKAAGKGQELQVTSARKPRTFTDNAIIVVLLAAIGGLLIATMTGTL